MIIHSKEDRARVKHMADEFVRHVAEREKNRPRIKEAEPIQAEVDETGISVELRALVARQRASDPQQPVD